MTTSTVTCAWWAGESIVRLSCVSRHVPANANGRPVSRGRIYAWTADGIDGIKLRRFRFGGQWCTTREELVRWQRALTEAAGSG